MYKSVETFENMALFLFSKGGVSLLNRLVSAVASRVGGADGAVRVVTVQPLTENGMPATRVWLSAVGIANFDYILLYHMREVSGGRRRVGSGICKYCSTSRYGGCCNTSRRSGEDRHIYRITRCPV